MVAADADGDGLTDLVAAGPSSMTSFMLHPEPGLIARASGVGAAPGQRFVVEGKDNRIDKPSVLDILEASGLGLPRYYDWRSRNGCTFCFYQQKIEWVRLKEQHPEAFEEAKSYEKDAVAHGSPFTWSQGESLDELTAPERVKQIKEDYDKRLERAKVKRQKNPLRDEGDELNIDELYGQAKGCLACHK